MLYIFAPKSLDTRLEECIMYPLVNVHSVLKIKFTFHIFFGPISFQCLANLHLRERPQRATSVNLYAVLDQEQLPGWSTNGFQNSICKKTFNLAMSNEMLPNS